MDLIFDRGCKMSEEDEVINRLDAGVLDQSVLRSIIACNIIT